MSGMDELILERLAAVESSVATGAMLNADSGYHHGALLLLSATENPQRVAKSTGDPCQSVVIENPTHLPLLVELDSDATLATARYRVPPYRGRVIAHPHRMVSVLVDPALIGEESGQLTVTVDQFLKGLSPGTFVLANSPAGYVIPNTISVGAGAVVTGPNVPAATVLLQAKISNTQPVFVGTAAQTAGNFGTDVGVLCELAAGAQISLQVPNIDVLTFGCSAAAVVYASAYR